MGQVLGVEGPLPDKVGADNTRSILDAMLWPPGAPGGVLGKEGTKATRVGASLELSARLHPTLFELERQ